MHARILKPALFGLLMLGAFVASGCGTLEIEFEPAAATQEPAATATGLPSADPTLAPTPGPLGLTHAMTAPVRTESDGPQEPVVVVAANDAPAEAAETAGPSAGAAAAPPDWQVYRSQDYGFGLRHPPGTFVRLLEPASPTACSAELPACIVEEQVFSAVVMQQAGDQTGLSGAGGPLAILELKLVTNPDGKTAGAMADLFSQRCVGALLAPVEPTTFSVQLRGYRYTCEGMAAFTEFWAPLGERADLLFGAAWAAAAAPLSEEILSTLTFADDAP